MKKNASFQKFFKDKAATGAKKKEAIRQEKRVFRKEREEGIAETKRFKRAQTKAAFSNQPPKYNLQPPGKTAYAKGPEGRPALRKPSPGSSAGAPAKSGNPTHAKAHTTGLTRAAGKRFTPQKGKPSTYNKPDADGPSQARGQRFAPKKASGYKGQGSQGRQFDDSKRDASARPQPRFTPKEAPGQNDSRPAPRKLEKPRAAPPREQAPRDKKPYNSNRKEFGPKSPRFTPAAPDRPQRERPKLERKPEPAPRPAGIKAPSTGPADVMPLNKYIAHGGLCSRREAVDYIKGGKVKVNGELILEPGHKVSVNDDVRVGGRKMNPVKDFVYILLNKPKDYITTTDDPQERRTVLDLIQGIPDIRIYPVGRLDRNTSGVLLLTNDGDLSQSLTHPSNEITKVYAVTLDKPLARSHFQDILKGVQLDDGPAYVDSLAFTDANDATQIGVELHTGRNRVVRRIFEHFGYDVKGLDRVVFAGLTKKNVNRGKWRYLSEKEVRDLKFFKKGRK